MTERDQLVATVRQQRETVRVHEEILSRVTKQLEVAEANLANYDERHAGPVKQDGGAGPELAPIADRVYSLESRVNRLESLQLGVGE